MPSTHRDVNDDAWQYRTQCEHAPPSHPLVDVIVHDLKEGIEKEAMAEHAVGW